MEASLLDRIKKQASCYIQQKYRNARMALTDVTDVELLTEEATNSYPCSPDAKTMTRIAQASFEFDNFSRIVHVLHRRLKNTDWKQWRQSYKSLVLLEFLITHGPEYFVEAFQCNTDVIQELGTFKYIDDKGFNWGVNMQKKSEHILELLGGGEVLKQARLKALKVSKEIKGFGNLVESPMSSSPPSSASPDSIRTLSFKSYTTTTSTSSEGSTELNKLSILSPKREIMAKSIEDRKKTNFASDAKVKKVPHFSNSDDVSPSFSDDERKSNSFRRGVYSETLNSSPRIKDDKVAFLRSLSDVGQTVKQRCKRQNSADY